MKKVDAIKYFGSPTKVAKVLGIYPAAVYQWGEDVPRLRAFEIERITGGKLKADAKPKGKST